MDDDDGKLSSCLGLHEGYNGDAGVLQHLPPSLFGPNQAATAADMKIVGQPGSVGVGVKGGVGCAK